MPLIKQNVGGLTENDSWITGDVVALILASYYYAACMEITDRAVNSMKDPIDGYPFQIDVDPSIGEDLGVGTLVDDELEAENQASKADPTDPNSELYNKSLLKNQPEDETEDETEDDMSPEELATYQPAT